MSDPYLYPGTTVLINHFNIRDQAKLDSKERRETLKTLKDLHDNPVKGEFDLAHLLEIHRRIIAPVYPFAGEIRRIDMSRPRKSWAVAVSNTRRSIWRVSRPSIT